MDKIRILLLFLFIPFITVCQENHPFFIGIQPSVTKEKFYSENEFDINVIPIVFQIGISKRMDIRLTTLGNYHFGDKRQFSDVGFELGSPLFFKKKAVQTDKSKGIFLTPIFAPSRNLLDAHYTCTFALETGYFFLITNRFALATQLQYGRSFFAHDTIPNEWVPHFGIKVNLGFWF